eukprot:1188194-Prorocentrum_minimum.AAC.4
MAARPKSACRSSSASLSLVLSSSWLGRPHCQLVRFSTALRSLSPVFTHPIQVSFVAVAVTSGSHPLAARSWILFPSRVMLPMFPARIAIFDPASGRKASESSKRTQVYKTGPCHSNL